MNIRRARPGDEAELTAMIHELAEFERAGHECTVTETQLRAALFGDAPTVRGHRRGGRRSSGGRAVVSQLLHVGRRRRHLPRRPVRTPEVPPRWGLARAMLATLARECVESGYTRLSWAVLDWNVDAIALYDAVGGRQQDEWITYRVWA